MNEFGCFIKKIREEKKMTLSYVADQIKINHAHLSRIENGDRNPPKVQTMRKLAKTLDVPLGLLMEKSGYGNLENEEEKSKKKLPSCENERELISKIDLSDNELLKQFTFVFEGKELAEKDVKRLLAYIRAERSLEE